MTLQEIESITAHYANERDGLAAALNELDRKIQMLKNQALPHIRDLAASTAECKAELIAAIEAAPELFAKKRTRVVAGIKIGVVKQRGKVEVDDEAACIKRIRAQLPAEQAELLIRVRESLHKPAVYDLVAADLKRLGIRIAEDEDQVIVKALDGEVDKIVDAMLADAGDIEEAAA